MIDETTIMGALADQLQTQLNAAPGDWDLRLALADELAGEGRADLAGVVISTAPADAVTEHHLLRASRHLLAVSPEKAIRTAKLARALNETSVDAELLCAEGCRLKGDPVEAEKHYLVASALDPSVEERTHELREWIAANAPSAAKASTGQVPVVLQVLDRSPGRSTGASLGRVTAPLADAAATPGIESDDEPVLVALPEPDEEPVLLAADAGDVDLSDPRPRQRRLLGAKVTAVAATLLIHAALIFLLGVLVVIIPGPPSAEITALSSAETTQDKPETKQIVVPLPTPSTAAVASPTSSALTAVGISPIALPSFDVKAPTEAVTEIATTDLGSSFSVAFQPKGTAQVNFFGIKAKGRRIAFLIEAERYMLTDPKGGIPAYEIVKDEIASMIGKFDVSTYYNVLLFDHYSLSAFSDKLVPATSANVAKVRDWFYPVNREFEKIGLNAINYPQVKASSEIEPIRSRLLQGYMLAIQYALESDVDTVFIITSGWRHMARYETKEELEEYLKEMRWTEKDEKEWQGAVVRAQAWLKQENEKRKAKGVPQRVIRSIHEIVAELEPRVRRKPGPNIDAEERQEQILNAMRVIYSSKGKPKPQINFVLFVGKDEKTIPMQEHFEEIAQRARSGKVRVLQGMAGLKNVTGRK